MSQHMSTNTVVGRKRHRCDLCGDAIEVGVRHRVSVWKDSGDFITTRYHLPCDMVPIIDKWDDVDWETGRERAEFKARLAELVASGEIGGEGR